MTPIAAASRPGADSLLTAATPGARAAAGLLALALWSCGEAPSPGGPGPAPDPASELPSPPMASAPDSGGYSDDASPQLLELREALERGRLAVAETLLGQLAGLIGVEEELLRARLFTLRNDGVEAIAAIERAKAMAPRDPRVFATAGEVYVLLGRMRAAQLEVHQAAAVAFDFDPKFSAPLERARGFLAIHQQGRVGEGFEHLNRALELDPNVPFVQRALFRANRLLAREALGRAEPSLAEKHARAALDYDPHDLESRVLVADAMLGQMRFDEAIEVHEELRAEGRGRRAELAQLYKRGGFASLLRGDREKALGYFARARALGLSDEALGSAANTLRDEFARRYDRGVVEYEDGRLADAEESFRSALGLLPDSVAGNQMLGVVLFRSERYREAAESWVTTLKLVEKFGVTLYEPVHLDLARAWRLADEFEKAREVLNAYLETGDTFWLEQSQDMLQRLDSETAAK